MIDRIYSFLGLATKAGKTLSGETGVKKAVKENKALLVLIAEDASDNTKKSFKNSCTSYGVDVQEFGEKQFLGKYCGKDSRSVVAISDRSFAEQLILMINTINADNGGAYNG